LQDGISRRIGRKFRKRKGREENKDERKSCAGWCLRLMSTAMIGLIKDKQSEGNGAVCMCQQVRQHKATCKQYNRSIHD
jgi:hypothetical protein